MDAEEKEVAAELKGRGCGENRKKLWRKQEETTGKKEEAGGEKEESAKKIGKICG